MKTRFTRISRSIIGGAKIAGIACVAGSALIAGATLASETRISLPPGYGLTSTDGVATAEGRHAFAIRESGSKDTSRVMQVAASGTVFTDLEGVADWVEYSTDLTHLLVRQALPEDNARRGAHLYSLVDNSGQIVWSTESPFAYRFTAGGNQLYVAQFPGDVPHIRVFDLRGNLIRSVKPRRPYLDARVLDGGEEALILFSTRRSRSTAPVEGREVSVERIRLDDLTVVWSVPLDQDSLKYPELIPLDRDWVLVPTEQGFVAVNRDGETTRFGSEGVSVAGGADLSRWRPAAGAGADSLILYDTDRTLLVDLAAGDLVEIESDPNSRFADVGYRDQHVVLVRPGEVVLEPLQERPLTGRGIRSERGVGKRGAKSRQQR